MMCSEMPCLVFLCNQGIQRSTGQTDRLLHCYLLSLSPVGWLFSVTNVFRGVEVTPYCSSGSLVDPLFLCNQWVQAAPGLYEPILIFCVCVCVCNRPTFSFITGQISLCNQQNWQAGVTNEFRQLLTCIIGQQTPRQMCWSSYLGFLCNQPPQIVAGISSANVFVYLASSLS